MTFGGQHAQANHAWRSPDPSSDAARSVRRWSVLT